MLESPYKKIIYLLRHGDVDGYKGKYLGQKNPSLSEKGFLQAKYWQKYFLSIELDKIYSSDLKRSMQTAHIILSHRRHKIKINYMSGLREINLGKWDGIDFEIIRRHYPYLFYKRGLNLEYFKPPLGENFSDLKNRVILCLNKIIAETKEKSLIVAHAGVNRVILATILKIPINSIFKIKQEHAVLNKILVEKNSLKIRLYNLRPKL